MHFAPAALVALCSLAAMPAGAAPYLTPAARPARAPLATPRAASCAGRVEAAGPGSRCRPNIARSSHAATCDPKAAATRAGSSSSSAATARRAAELAPTLAAPVIVGRGSVLGATPRRKATAVEVFARLLGYGVTLGSFTLKLPQIQRCLGSRSVEGLSWLSQYCELNVYLGAALYHLLKGYPLSSWAENISLVLQQVVIVGLLWTLAEAAPSPLHMVSVLAFEALFVGGAFKLPQRLWPLLLLLNGALSVLGHISQLWITYGAKSVGQLSAVTLALSLAGNGARVVTTLVFARGDATLLALFGLSFGLNTLRAIQYALYR